MRRVTGVQQVCSKGSSPSADEVRQALARILGSESFAKSRRNRELLHYLVKESLAGKSARLKGYRIAVDVFGKEADFDAQNNPLVRNQMVRLRRALEHYHLGEGISDPVVIRFNKGEYAPDIFYRDSSGNEIPAQPAEDTARVMEKPVLVILPFDCLEESAEQWRFAAGLTRELTAALSRFDHLQIVTGGGNTAETGTGDSRCYLLQGQSRQYASRLRINLELTEQGTHVCLWAEKYECDLNVEDLFELQDRITREVAAEVADHYGIIPRRLTANLHSNPPRSLTAYEAVLGFYHYELDLKEALLPGIITDLERALDIEPDYALGWAALAEAYADRFVWGFCCDQGLLDRSKRYSDKAISLDPACQHAHWSRALAYHLSPGQQDVAMSRRAIDTLMAINPNAAGFVCGSGLLLALQGEWERGLSVIRQFYNHNLHNPRWINLADQLSDYLDANFQKSLIHSQQIKTEMAPWDFILKALCHWNLEQREETISAFADLMALNPEFSGDPSLLERFIAAYIKDSEAFRRIMNDLTAIASSC